ncbi:MAG: glutathione S-transferase [Alphaproteobacteria bacterium]|nr:glutathione S-transferase [Alphaproteobacteria bacterium]|tara:strand:+ start:1162 stop:1776 length:615 start_codon:yes stop_codon:yes gene_type:complete
MSQNAILYSFRRCPYAMRARLGLKISGLKYEHREIVLRNKPKSMLEYSPKGTVPVFITDSGNIIDESLDIMFYALGENDPEHWLAPPIDAMKSLISQNDGDFKKNLDRYKYPTRYPKEDCSGAKENGLRFISLLNEKLSINKYLFGEKRSLADMAIFPFIRQFSKVEADDFQKLPYPHLQNWLNGHLNSEIFKEIMKKHTLWED